MSKCIGDDMKHAIFTPSAHFLGSPIIPPLDADIISEPHPRSKRDSDRGRHYLLWVCGVGGGGFDVSRRPSRASLAMTSFF